MDSKKSENPLVGTWKLLSREDVTTSGERRTEPILGSNPIAYLIYDAAGHFAVQFMKRDRKSGQATEAQATGGANNNGVYTFTVTGSDGAMSLMRTFEVHEANVAQAPQIVPLTDLFGMTSLRSAAGWVIAGG